jgi:hypothetical protein
MFTYYEPYQVLLCRKHRCAVYSLDKHLKQQHGMPAAERRALLATYKGINLLPPAQVSQPLPHSSRAINELGPAQDAFLCCDSSAAIRVAEAGVAAAAVAVAAVAGATMAEIATV